MKYAMQLFIVWISINMMSGVLYQLGVPPMVGHLDSTDPEQVHDAFDPNSTIVGWSDEVGYTIGDPVRGMWNLWGTIGIYVAAFPIALRSWGVPAPIVAMMDAIWIIIWATFAWGFISGRWLSD